MNYSGRFTQGHGCVVIEAMLMVVLGLFSLSAIGGEGNFLAREQERVKGMSELEENYFTLISYVKIKNEFKDLSDHNNELMWPLKVFAIGNKILHVVSTDRNPFKDCFAMRYENLEGAIRGEITFSELQKREEGTASCIEDGGKTLTARHGREVYEGLEMSERDRQSLQRIIGLAKVAASE
jgi:hypothetical protein